MHIFYQQITYIYIIYIIYQNSFFSPFFILFYLHIYNFTDSSFKVFNC